MATIALYKHQLEQIPDLIREVKQSVMAFDEDLFSLKKTTMKVKKASVIWTR